MLEKKHFALKAIPPRPTFQQDMTEDEREIMLRHFAYWTEQLRKGTVHVFGPVFDPSGGYGLAIIEVDSADQVQSMIANDPAVISGLLMEEFYPMRAILPERV
ncbi:YciI family protein [Sporolactobacillus putidus]|uniref:YCII-related domain-containing protein n=1 Tax=Sporolactobacillus putidus TaxID=492735 RepID=A0A917RXX1_9BACL|nr:YciI family protein [Sporolactobacillus putidus]GGL41552.1 hypothetical protein GCM10007968_01800 [Sporolactobacillus putidus]